MISATVVGHLGRDAELKTTPDGTSIVNFSVASNTRKKDEHGAWGDATDWVNVSLFGDRGAKLVAYLTKGKAVAVRGALTVREYEGRDHAMRVSLDLKADDIELLGGKGEGATAAPSKGSGATRRSPPPPREAPRQAPLPTETAPSDAEDDIPF